MRSRNTSLGLALGLALTLAAGCGTTSGTTDDELLEGGDETAEALKADAPGLPFTVFKDSIGTAGAQATRVVITSAAGYLKLFGHAAPGVTWGKEWVVFYSAGVKMTGGYTAAIEKLKLSASGLTLTVTTALESPGAGCAVTQALTKPYVLARFAVPAPKPKYLSYKKHDTTKSCQPPKGACKTDADCTLAADYCTSCLCRALGPGETIPPCAGPGVKCFADPCLNKEAGCVSGKCEVRTGGKIPCGKSFCGAGAYCCNKSCGICAPIGGFCTQQMCE